MQNKSLITLVVGLIILTLGGFVLMSWDYLGFVGGWSAGFLLLVSIVCLVLWRVMPGERSPVSVQRAWLRPGLGAGLAVGLIALPCVSGLITLELDVFMIVAAAFLVLMPALFGLAGYIGGRASMQVRQGLFAGALASLTSAAVLFAGLVLVMTIVWPGMREAALRDTYLSSFYQSSGMPTFDAYIWSIRMNTTVGLSLFVAPFGPVMGMLGGLIGSARARRLSVVGA